MIISFSNLSFLIELCILFIIMNIIYFDIFVNYYDHITIETINFSIVQSSIFIFDKIFKTSEYKKKNRIAPIQRYLFEDNYYFTTEIIRLILQLFCTNSLFA